MGNVYIISTAIDVGLFIREAERFKGILKAEDVYEFVQMRGLGRNQEGSRKTVVWIESLSCNNEVVLMRFVVTLLLECNFCILSL